MLNCFTLNTAYNCKYFVFQGKMQSENIVTRPWLLTAHYFSTLFSKVPEALKKINMHVALKHKITSLHSTVTEPKYSFFLADLNFKLLLTFNELLLKESPNFASVALEAQRD